MCRCGWCQDDGLLQKYHDGEWGIPVHDDKKQFEFLMLEVMQCGLNWNMMLKKRDVFRACFDDFDFEKIALYTDADAERILNTEGMIKSPRKVNAIIHNARLFMDIRREFGSFDEYIWGWSGHKTILYRGHGSGRIPAKNRLSDTISADLKKRGFKYLGSITVYSHLQACGIINDHHKDCFMYPIILANFPTVNKLSRDEG